MITDAQIQAAMRFYELKAGKPDGISICSEVSSLANVLGTMWYSHEKTAVVIDDGPVHTLLLEAGVSFSDEPHADEALQADELPKG
jgi:hypothetical protein